MSTDLTTRELDALSEAVYRRIMATRGKAVHEFEELSSKPGICSWCGREKGDALHALETAKPLNPLRK